MPAVISPHTLRQAVRASEHQLEVFRTLRVEAFREFWGRFFNGGDLTKRHLNLINRAISVLVPHMASGNIEHELETDDIALEGESALLSMYLDRLSTKLRRTQMTRSCLQDAFLGPCAIVRCGRRSGGELVKSMGRIYDRGQFYWRRVPFDDYVCDPSARCDEELLWEGEFYRADRFRLLESGLFNPAVVERLTSLSEHETRDRYGLGSRGKLEEESRGRNSREDVFGLVDRVELLDIALYDDGVTYIVTMPAEDGFDDGEFLRISTWEGATDARGPFEKLCFTPVNEQPMGLPPVAMWREQAEAFYTIVGKMVKQIEETKRNLLVDDSVSDDELDEIREAEDGETIRVANSDAFQMVEFGGSVKELGPASEMIYQWFNVSSSNVDILGGAGADTDKATIFAGLQANAGAMVEDYQVIHDEFQERLSRHAAFDALHDPLLRSPMTYRIPGGEAFEVVYDASQRMGEYESYRYKIRPRSMGRQDPGMRTQRLMQALQVIMQAAQAAQLTGGYVNLPGVARVTARALGMSDIELCINDPVLAQIQAMTRGMLPQGGQGTPMPVPGLNMGAASYRMRPVGGAGMGAGRQGAGVGMGDESVRAGLGGRPAAARGMRTQPAGGF